MLCTEKAWPTFGLIVERRQLNAACPHRNRVEVGRVYSHASGVGPHQMTLGMSEIQVKDLNTNVLLLFSTKSVYFSQLRVSMLHKHFTPTLCRGKTKDVMNVQRRKLKHVKNVKKREKNFCKRLVKIFAKIFFSAWPMDQRYRDCLGCKIRAMQILKLKWTEITVA